MYTGIRLLLLIHDFISSFFFLSNYQTLKTFRHNFLRNCESRRLKCGTLVDSGQMYRIYRNQAAAAFFVPLFLHFSFLSNFQTLKLFITLFTRTVRPRRLKVGIPESGCCLSVPLFLHFLSLLFSSLKTFRHTSYRNCEDQKVKTWYTCGQWQRYPVYQNQAAAAYSPLYVLFFLSQIFKH